MKRNLWLIALSLITLFGLASPSAAANRVLLLYSDSDAQGAFVKQNLVTTGAFTSADIDTLAFPSTPPALTTLQSYAAIYVWTNNGVPSQVAQGDRLRDYVQAGGKVIMLEYSFVPASQGFSLSGGIMTSGYCPFVPTTVPENNFPRALDFNTALANDPILKGVSDFTYGGNNVYCAPQLDAGATLVARDNLGQPLIARNINHNVIAFNLYPGGQSQFGKSAGVWRALANAGAPNSPPQANPGAARTIEATGPTTPVALDGTNSFDPEGSPLTYTWTGPFGTATGPTPVVPLALGSWTITLVVNDGTTNSAPNSVVITVIDSTPPNLTVPGSIVAEATGPNGAVVNYPAPTATDLVDGSVSVSTTAASGSVFPLGVTVVTCMARDSSNNQAVKSFTITVQDTTPPMLALPPAQSAEATGANGAVVHFQTASASDAVSTPTIAYSPAQDSLFPLGSTPVVVTAKDAAGNTATGSFQVTVGDTTPPVITVPSDITAEATSAAGAVVTFSPTAKDAVDGTVAVTSNPASGSTFAFGTTVVTCTAADKSGNQATATFKVTVSDSTPPTLKLPPDQTFEATSANGAKVHFQEATATDTVSTPTITYNPAQDTQFPIGTTTVAVTATDAAGNAATGSFKVSVGDTTGPVITVPGDITAEATSASGAAVNFTLTANDAVDGSVAVTANPASGSTFPLGTTVVNCTATDKSGNQSTASFKVTVVDTTPPAITLPPDQSFEATGANGAKVHFQPATATDAVSTPTIAYNPAQDSLFPIGTTTVVVTASDAAGNAATGSFKVTVGDNTGPVITVPADITAEATSASGAAVNFTVTATDAVDGTVPVTATPASGSTFALGNTVVTCTAMDKSGNQSTASFKVTVVDTTAPTITLPPDQTFEATNANGAKVHFQPATSTDAVSTPTIAYNPAQDSQFPVGTTTVTVTATDAAGNSATGSFKVTVGDTTGPVIAVPADITAEATSASGAAVNFTVTATDAVDGTVPVTATPASGSTFPVGTTVVNCTATDKSGNQSTASFKVTVVDTTPPAISLPPDQTFEATSANGATVMFQGATATDAVSTPTISYNPTQGSVFPIGATTVTVTAKDAAGNTATGSFKVTVSDSTAPAITVPSDISAEATSSAGAVVNFSVSAKDAVDGTVPVTVSPASGSTFPIGTTVVTCTAADKSGNQSKATFRVTVADTTPPTITVPADITTNSTSSSGAVVNFTVSASDIVDGSVPVTANPPSGSTFPIGTTTVQCTATDHAGNTGTASFRVTVKSSGFPTIKVPRTIFAEATGPQGAAVTFTVTATDAVDGTVPVTCSPASGSMFPLGRTVVHCSATNSGGNTATATFSVRVIDTTPPQISEVPDLQATATRASGAVVTFAPPVATDLVDGNVPVSCSPASGSRFPLGESIVFCWATDRAGNTAFTWFTVTVTYSWSGFFTPLSSDSGSAVTVGTQVPVRFRLTGASTPVTDAKARFVFRSAAVDGDGDHDGDTGADGDSEGGPNPSFQYDVTTGSYVYVWDTTGLQAGRYTVRVKLGDGVVRKAHINLN